MKIEKILLIDDETDIRLIARLALESLGPFIVVDAGDGESGAASAVADRPDLILLDVTMPLVDGPATLQRLRAHPDTAAIPVIFMTAKTRHEELERFLALGVAGVIHKPFDPMRLCDEIRQILAPASR